MNDMTPIAPATLGKLAKALAAAQAEMKPAAKDANNPHFKSKYADLEAVNEAARVLANHGIAIMCVPDGWSEGRIVIRAMLVHESGELMEGRLEMPVAQANNPQAVGSALTYARRYAVSALANIATSDDDGNAATDGVKDEPRKVQPRTVPESAEGSERHAAPKNTDKGVDKVAEIDAKAMAKADAIIIAIDAAGSLADASRVLIDEGLADIDDGAWQLDPMSALDWLRKARPAEFARIQGAYAKRQEAV